MKFVIQPNFLTLEDVEVIKSYKKPSTAEIQNYHIKSINDEIQGWSVLHDLSKTDLTKEITYFQGDGTLAGEVPSYYYELGYRIAKAVNIDNSNMFFQYIFIGPNGKIRKHYDTGKPGYITYKCNVCVEGPAYDVIHVDKEVLKITPLGLYCFEANFYKHWMDMSEHPRIHLSYGYILPYSDLEWDSDSPRVRLSNRIWKSFQN